MTYPTFNPALPNGGTPDNQTGAQVLQSVRDNCRVSRDMAVCGIGFGWNYESSTETTKPVTEYFKKGAEWIKIDITWGTTGGALNQKTVIVFKYSANSGGAYDTIGTLTNTYNTAGRVTGYTWS